MPRLLGEPQGFHLSTGTGEAVSLFVTVIISVYVVFGVYIKKCFLLQFVYLLVVVFCVKSTASALAYFHSVTVCKIT